MKPRSRIEASDPATKFNKRLPSLVSLGQIRFSKPPGLHAVELSLHSKVPRLSTGQWQLQYPCSRRGCTRHLTRTAPACQCSISDFTSM